MVSTVLARREQFHQQILVSHLTPLDGSYAGVAQNIANALMKSAAMLAVDDTFWILALMFLSMTPWLSC